MPPSEPPPSYDALIETLSRGEKNSADWRLGVEHEKFGFSLPDYQPLPYKGKQSVRAVLDYLTRFDWKPVYEGEEIIALTAPPESDGFPSASITLEPGGQFELSGRPLASVHENCSETHTHLAQVKEASEKLGVGFLGVGFAPHWPRSAMSLMPKARYEIMDAYMPTRGTKGFDMMRRTCTMQVNLDFSSEKDMVAKMRLGLALQPLATALFANSPLVEGKPSGWLSARSAVWQDVDPDRTGMLPFVFEDGFGYQRYVDYALDVPMYFLRRDGGYINVAGASFRRFLEKGLDEVPTLRPTLEDWRDHLTTIFPEVRLKHFIEMRGADGGGWSQICALPAFWAGLLYDADCQQAASDEVKGWTAEMRHQARLDAARFGLKAEIGGETMQTIARRILAIARRGLEKRARLDSRGRSEAIFLEVLEEIAESGITPAEQILARWQGEWGENPAELFEACAY